MNPKELWLPSDTGNLKWVPAGLWMCGTCNTVHPGSCFGQPKEKWSELSKKSAERCCRPANCVFCGHPVPVIKNINSQYATIPTIHEECKALKESKEYKESIEKAQEVSVYEGVLFDDPDNEFYSDIEAFTEHWNYCNSCNAEPYDLPEEYFLFCTKPVKPIKMSLEDYFEAVDDRAGVDDLDCREHIEGIADMMMAIEKFNKANEETIIGWEPDYSRKVKLTKKDFEE